MNIIRNIVTAALMTVVTTLLLGIVYPLAVTGIAQVLFPDKANGQLMERNGKVVGSRIIGQGFSSAGLFPVEALGRRHRLRCGELRGHAAWSDQQEAGRQRQGERRDGAQGECDRPGPDRPGHHFGVGPRSSPLACGRGLPGRPRCPRARDVRVGCSRARRLAHRRTSARLPRRTARQGARAQPRARRRPSHEGAGEVTVDLCVQFLRRCDGHGIVLRDACRAAWWSWPSPPPWFRPAIARHRSPNWSKHGAWRLRFTSNSRTPRMLRTGRSWPIPTMPRRPRPTRPGRLGKLSNATSRRFGPCSRRLASATT